MFWTKWSVFYCELSYNTTNIDCVPTFVYFGIICLLEPFLLSALLGYIVADVMSLKKTLMEYF